MKNIKSRNKQLILSIIAFLIMFFSRWVFLRIEIDAVRNNLCFIIESVLFTLIYVLSIFGVPRIIQAITLLVGCGGMSFIYTLSEGAQGTDALLPMAYIPIFLFYISQNGQTKWEKNKVFSLLWTILMTVFLISFSVLIMVFIVKRPNTYRGFRLYDTVIFVLVAAIYFMILLFVPKNNNTPNKNKKNKKNKRIDAAEWNGDSAGFGFVFGLVALIESGIFLQLCGNSELVHVLPLLWIVDLIFLQDLGHPCLTAFSGWFQKKIDGFLKSEG